MSKITATIITFNEARRIGNCLDSLRDIADEIIVIDSFSTDDTVAICKERGCTVRCRRFAGYGAQRQYATSLASHPYVLTIDADEELSPALRQSLLQLKNGGDITRHRVYSFSRLNFYCGQPVKHCGWYPDEQIRLFDKRYANWNLRDVREKVIFRDTVRPQHLDGDILHYRCSTPGEYAATERRHAFIRGRVLAASRDSVGVLAPLTGGIRAYLKCFIAQGGIFDGMEGHAISSQRYRSAFIALKMARRLIKQDKSKQTQPTS